MSATCDALVVYADFAVMAAALLDRSVVKLSLGQRTGAVLSDGEYVGGALDESVFYGEGNFIITGLDMNAADQDNASYSASFENADGSFAFSDDPTFRVTIAKSHVTVNAGSDGAVMAIPKGGVPPYTFLWDNDSEDTQCVEGLTAGTYSVTVTDSTLVTPLKVSASVTLTEPAA
jgi:hypothetical protein